AGPAADALNVSVSATGDLTIDANVAAGTGAVTLAADVKPDGSPDDGVGTLSVGPGGAVTGSDVTLRGADVHLDTSAKPARVSATGGQVSTFATGIDQPEGIAFDAQGNLYVANAGNSVGKVTPGGVVSTFASGLDSPFDLAFDSRGNLYVSSYYGG